MADREGIFRLGLKKLFAVEDDLRVVAEAADAEHLQERARSFQPDVIFVQEEILAQSGANLIGELVRAVRHCKVVVTTSSPGEESGLQHVRNGAAGIILKTVDPSFFVKCARRVKEGETWIPTRQVSRMAKLLEAQPVNPRPVDTLTRREKTIISYLMQGWRNREISTHLSISEQTVKNHLRTIYDKVGVSDRLELVLYAIHQRLELPPVQAIAPPS